MNSNGGSVLYDFMKTQMFMSVSGGRGGVQNLILWNLYEQAVASFPKWFPIVKAFCCKRKNQSAQSSSPPPPPNKEIKAEIYCERILSSSNANKQQVTQTNHSRMDSVVHYVTTIPAIRNLICMTHHDYLPNEFDIVMIEPDVYFKLEELKHSDGQLEMIRFKLFCYEHEVQHLQTFVDKCNVDYERRMANKLGTSLYYFDMMTQSKNKRSIQNPLPPTHLLYTKHRFQTTRTFDNVFFEQRKHVKSHIEFFLNRRDWYEKKGIPYTLGFMFHGPPGTGKTSSIKALANTARRHIVNVQLSQIKTKEQLRHLFFNDEIHVYNGTNTERYTIPVHERLYVIEDIDAMGDVVLRREWKKPQTEEKKKTSNQDPWLSKLQDEEDQSEPIDLSFLLNLLDGTLEASGRILAISSNFPERIDKALIRPGRIDMIIHFKKCNRDILREMVESFYDRTFDDWTTEDLDYKWSPAEVNQILFRNFNKYEDAINEIKTLTPKDLYGFDEKNVTLDYSTFETS